MGVERPKRIRDYRKRWLISVGINHYNGQINSLSNAVNDACAVYQYLTSEFAFNGMLLCRNEDASEYDPAFAALSRGNGSQADILDSIDEIANQSTEEDLFVFFYSGHATNDGYGYLVPYGSIRNDHATYLMYETFFGALTVLPCVHKLLFFDGCYTGITTRGPWKLTLEDSESPNDFSNQGSIELEEKTVIIAATGSFDRALDSFQNDATAGFQSSKHSPFTQALLDTLSEIKPGESVLPAWIYNNVFQHVRNFLEGSQQQPRLYDCGDGLLSIERPGIRIKSPANLHYLKEQNKTEIVQLVADGGQPPYSWCIEDPEKGIEVRESGLRIKPDILGMGTTLVTLCVTDKNGMVASQGISVRVTEGVPLEITSRRLPPCILGEEYRTGIDVAGGKPPLQWRVEGLPPGFRFCSMTGKIFGYIPEDYQYSDEETSPLYSHILKIIVTDSNGQKVKKKFKLVTLSYKDYCEVPEGRFLIGYHPTETRTKELKRLGFENELPLSQYKTFPKGTAYLPKYFIKKYPVTNQEWRLFLNKTGYHAIPDAWLEGNYNDDEADLPVTGISVSDMEEYCRWRGTSLPTGWEWEKAARGLDGYIYPWGDYYHVNYCNCPEIFWDELTKIDQFPCGASVYGVLDMIGNNRETTREFYPVGEGLIWANCLRGGGYDRGGLQHLVFVANQGNRYLLNSSNGALKPTGKDSLHITGFRDVIKVDDEPFYQQGFVSLETSGFLSPSSGKERNTRQVYIARYAVSNQEYAEFVQDTGYRAPAHWLDAGNNNFGFEERYLPVVNVSFEDASEFCKWLSVRLFKSDDKIRILSQRHWEVAVHGPGQSRANFRPRKFPWGDEFDSLKCNCSKSGWGSVVRVFDLQEGKAPCGAINLLGNVAEWVAPNTVAGGSWLNECNDPQHWFYACQEPRHDVGFRYYSTIESPES